MRSIIFKRLILCTIIIGTGLVTSCFLAEEDTYSVYGTVLDYTTETPIPDMQVCLSVLGSSYCDYTNVNGEYKINIVKENWGDAEICVEDRDDFTNGYYYTTCEYLNLTGDEDVEFDLTPDKTD
jgi:hypothetical protein